MLPTPMMMMMINRTMFRSFRLGSIFPSDKIRSTVIKPKLRRRIIKIIYAIFSAMVLGSKANVRDLLCFGIIKIISLFRDHRVIDQQNTCIRRLKFLN